MQSKHCLTSVTLPDSVTIFGTNINVHVNEVSHRELSNLTESRISLETLILRNPTGKTEFLMWISSYCIACIYQQNTKVKQLFSPLTYQDSHSPTMKQTMHICSVDNLVEEINNIIQNKQECQTMEYDIQFICCSCKITEIERKHIIRELRKKHMYDSMEPVARKRFLEDIKRKYSTMDGKQCICNTCHSKVIKGKLPCQAVVNKMYVDEIPTELSSLEKQEQIQIAKRIVFKKYCGHA